MDQNTAMCRRAHHRQLSVISVPRLSIDQLGTKLSHNKPTPGKRTFSVDLKSKSSLRSASLGNGHGDGVTIEGTIGAFKHAEFVEDTILELVGTEGTLRIDLSREEIERCKIRGY